MNLGLSIEKASILNYLYVILIMMINNIPHEFEFLSNIRKKVTFKENKIYFPFDSVFFYWLGCFATIILP
ncbi:MAG: hypothetical protein J6Z11_11465, partial [Candidatus Riflebacteria bacterium]|nr:hypothetical protein [Candidatus Riflebacteria bacterium]